MAKLFKISAQRYDQRKRVRKENTREAATFSQVAMSGYKLISRKHMDPLANALSRNRHLREIELRDCQLRAQPLESLAISLMDIPHLNQINLTTNTLERGVAHKEKDKYGFTAYETDLTGMLALGQLAKKQQLLRILDLSKNGLTYGSAEILMENLPGHPSLTELNLSVNDLGPKGAVYIAKILKKNPVLRLLDVRSNRLMPVGVDLLCRALRTNMVLTSLNLRNNKIDSDTIRVLADTLRVGAKSLVHLDLGYNHIDPHGLKTLGYAMLTPRVVLQTLILDHNPLTNAGKDFDGVKGFSKALRNNRTLTYLSMQGVRLVADSENVRYSAGLDMRVERARSIEGIQALAEALRINNVLMAVDLRQNKISPHSARCVINAFRVKPTCLPFVKIVRRSVDWFLARVLYRYPEYPMASRSWLRIRLYRNLFHFMEQERQLIGDW